MQKRFFLVWFIFFSVYQTDAMFTQNAAKQKVFMQKYLQKQKFCCIPEKVPRGLLIFLDEEEGSQFRALSNQLFITLSQKAGPILTSTTLLHSFFACQNKMLSDEELDALLKGDETNLKNSAWKSLKFNGEEWIIKQQPDLHLSLLIPCAYLEQCGVDIDQARRDDVAIGTISEAEFTLGLKINHMKTVHMQDVVPQLGGKINQYFIKNLRNIFCLKSEYHACNKFVYPLWTFYLTGHGAFDQHIAGIHLETFGKVLNFFEKDICTRLFMYDSCYAGGQNGETVYRNSENSMQKTYSFSIVSVGLNDVSVCFFYFLTKKVSALFWRIFRFFGIGSSVIQMFFEFSQRFDLFLNEITKNETMTTRYCKEMVQRVVVQSIKNEKWITLVQNTPQIRPAGLEWFAPIDIENTIISIYSALAQSGRKKIDVATFFKYKKDPKVILMYAHNMPFELVISKSITDIVSMIPGSAIHTIKGINSQKNECLCIEDLFKIFDEGKPRKIFFINTIKDARKEWQDVLVYNDNNQVNILYTSCGKRYARYKKDGQFIDELCNKEKNNKYDELLSEVNFFDAQSEGSIFQGGIYHRKKQFHCYYEFAPTIILPKGIIVIDNMSVSYTDEIFKVCKNEFNIMATLLSHLQDNLKRGSHLWIKKCTGKDKCFDDVFILGDRFYFTYDGKVNCVTIEDIPECRSRTFNISLCSSSDYLKYRSKIEERLKNFGINNI